MERRHILRTQSRWEEAASVQPGLSRVRAQSQGSLAQAARGHRGQACVGREPRAASSEEAAWSWIWAQGRRLRAHFSPGTGERPADRQSLLRLTKTGSCFRGRFRKKHSPAHPLPVGLPSFFRPSCLAGPTSRRATAAGSQVLACGIKVPEARAVRMSLCLKHQREKV